DAKRFISGMSKIWKLDNYSNSSSFTDWTSQSIDDLHESHTTAFKYVDEKGDICCIIFLIQPLRDGKLVQVAHTHHKLSQSGSRKNATDNAQTEEYNARQWLVQRACNELRLPESIMKSIMYLPYNNCTEYDLKVDEATAMPPKIYSTPSPNENHYYIIHRKHHGKQFLKTVQQISNFSKYISHPEEFVEELATQIQNVQRYEDFSYEASYSKKEKCTLGIIVLPDQNPDIVHMTCDFQINPEGSKK
ncbi:unnamed protein product, partial [Adineta steineri]